MNQDIDASISLPLRVPADPAAWRGLSSTEFRQAVVANQAELGSFPETDGKKNFFLNFFSLLMSCLRRGNLNRWNKCHIWACIGELQGFRQDWNSAKHGEGPDDNSPCTCKTG